MDTMTQPGTARLDPREPEGPLENQWDIYKETSKLVAPSNKRKYTVIVVGTGLAGASAAATLAELGYNVTNLCLSDSPRRAHSIAAQGGINAAKNYQNDGDSVWRLFHDTIKGGDFRSRESNTHRLSQLSTDIIDQCAAQGIPFAREYGGGLANRSFGGAQVSRTFYARGQTGQQLLLGAYGALLRQVDAGRVTLRPRREMLDLVLVDGQARGIIARNLVTGEIERYAGNAVVLATGGYSTVFYLSTNAVNSNVTAAWRCHKQGAFFANPCYTQIHPTCLPQAGAGQSKLTLMSESLRNDGRVWVPQKDGDHRPPAEIPETERDYYLERLYPSFGNLVPRDIASRRAKEMCDQGKGVGSTGLAVYLDFAEAISRLGEDTIRTRYGNLFSMYHEITADDPYKAPMQIYPAPHYTMGGLWVDYHLMSTIPGLFVAGEANFSDHGANRLGASALMQGLADGYFVIPPTVANYLAEQGPSANDEKAPEFDKATAGVSDRVARLLAIDGKRTVRELWYDLGRILWNQVGLSRSEAGLTQAIEDIRSLRSDFWSNAKVTGGAGDFNQDLEVAGRVADYMELGEVMAMDALQRAESCGAHFREEHVTPEGEALRRDDAFSYVAAWEHKGQDTPPEMHQEPLDFKRVTPSQRSYT